MHPLFAVLTSAVIASSPGASLAAPSAPAVLAPPGLNVAAREVWTLVLTVRSGEGAEPPDRYAVLDCRPAGGSHPRPAEACAALERVGGDPARLRSRPMSCPMIYSPVTVTATGVWGGTFVSYRHTFGNRCEMRTRAGDLFNI